MSELQNLVPPLELCRKIPPGEFKDSAMVWLRETGNSGRYYIAERNDYLDRVKRIPAPTLQEIFDALAKMETCPEMCVWSCDKDGTCFRITADFTGDEDGYNAAEAALQLWLELYNQ